jgi:hypothetical protein
MHKRCMCTESALLVHYTIKHFPLILQVALYSVYHQSFFRGNISRQKRQTGFSWGKFMIWDRCDQWVRLLVTALARKPGFPITASCGVCLPRALCRHCSSPWTRQLPVTGYFLAIYSSSECSTTRDAHLNSEQAWKLSRCLPLELRTLHWP